VGYSFELSTPGDGASYSLNDWQFGFVREALREVGAAVEAGYQQALETAGFEPSADSVDMLKFRSNSNWHVTAAEAAFVAGRLRAGLAAGVVSDLLSFFDDAPPEARTWVAEFAAFNERAAAGAGYRVR
jgi:hypothetical protein